MGDVDVLTEDHWLKKTGVPWWALSPFNIFFDQLAVSNGVVSIIDLSMEGLPLIHEMSVVHLWSSLEFLTLNFAEAWMLNEPSALKVDNIQKIKIPLAKFLTLNREEQIRLLVFALDESVGGPVKKGVGRFECLLEVFNFGGAVDDEVRRTLLELSQVRNVIVHRRGQVDRRFVEGCPWLDLQIGQKIKIERSGYDRYLAATANYARSVRRRVYKHFGVILPDSAEQEF